MSIRRSRSRSLAFAVPLLAALSFGGCIRYTPEEALYRKHCADCHGIDGAGNTPRYMGNQWANLIDSNGKSGSGDDYTIEGAIREGVFGEMPGNSQLSDEEVKQIIAWVRHLRGEGM